jgi:hypothetical protein
MAIDKHNNLESRLMKIFSDSGWTFRDPALQLYICNKGFTTFVGIKEAFLYFYKEENGFCMTCNYMSEGRNILSGIFVLFHATDTDTDLKQRADDALCYIQDAINDSYAMRLLRLAEVAA